MITENYIGQRNVIVENYANHHTAEGGLELLEHLGLEITAEEKLAFFADWSRYYAREGRHFLSAVCGLYSGLTEDESAKNDRRDEFTKKVNSVKLLSWIRE